MIRETWYATLSSREVPAGRLVGATRFGEKLVFWREPGGGVACLADRCAHRGASLALGALADGHAQCPFHGLEYDAQGRCTLVPANGRGAAVPDYIRVGAYPCVERHGFIWVYWGERRENIGEPPFFDDLGPEFRYGEMKDPWPVHYSRVIENQLDVVHLPFVHRTTIGRGHRTVVNGPVEREGERSVEIWVYNEPDTGQKPRKAAELPQPDPRRQHLHFIFPNLWQNWITRKLRVTAFFVPVDDENTMLYLRFYHAFLTLPGLRQLLEFVGNRMNFTIERQDRRVVSTQLPKKSALKMDEKLIPGDAPIVSYRRIRQRLLDEYGGR